ncbi:hypothetical protein HW450_09080 [Corynebacterium hindlerae]|uniref:Uncharacterized protein n=1 Tax=Corynebacterium hindlerae TaxID=699041 RepID=A0A7G5FD23_9CORY|nr:hypothetical protein [Corynebacterium hindlerae]QMV84514.1 hypothetical protein HW450_09080 [Corynebacterium hindlerae]
MATGSPWEALCTSSFQKISPSAFRRLTSKTEVSAPELRAYIYSDIHLRGCESAALFADLPTVTQFVDLAAHTVHSPGWDLVDGELRKDGQFTLRPDQFPHTPTPNGQFTVALPRLRVNALPGWLVVESLEPPRLTAAWRLYLPGVSLRRFSALVDFMDRQTHLPRWSMKTTLGQSRDLRLIPRPDATVIYFDPAQIRSGALGALVDAISAFTPGGHGPGFSMQLTESVWIGGPGINAHTSFGAGLSAVAAQCLVRNDFNELHQRENAFRNEVDSLV